MHGFHTRSFDHAEALHHRETGSADGRLRGHVRWGNPTGSSTTARISTLARAGKVARLKPRGVSGLAYLYGYARAGARGVERVEVDGYKDFVRAEQRRRMANHLPGHSATAADR